MEYEPTEYEPQEHDEIGVKVMELIKEEVRAKMTETVDNLEMFRKTNASLGASLRKEREEHSTLKRSYEKDLNTALKAKEKEVIRELFGGLAQGDKAYHLDYKYESAACLKCKGTKKVTAIIDKEELKVKCPECDGQGSKSNHRFVVKEGKIEAVSLEINDYAKFLSFYFVNGNSKVEGVAVFKTAEECQLACDEKNKPKEVKK